MSVCVCVRVCVAYCMHVDCRDLRMGTRDSCIVVTFVWTIFSRGSRLA